MPIHLIITSTILLACIAGGLTMAALGSLSYSDGSDFSTHAIVVTGFAFLLFITSCVTAMSRREH